MGKAVMSIEEQKGSGTQFFKLLEEDFALLPRTSIMILLLPGLVILALFAASYSSFISVSFHQSVSGKAAWSGALTLNNYQRFFSDPLYPSFLLNTLYLSAQMTMGSLLLAYPLAYCLARSSSTRIRYIILISLIVPFLSGGLTRAYAWMVILGNKGLVNSSLLSLGFIESPLRLIYNRFGVITSLIHFLLPFTTLSLVGPIRNVPRALEEAAVNLGASRPNVFLRVMLPLTLPGIVDAVSLTYAIALSSFLFPMLLGGGRVNMMANVIFESIFVSFDFPLAATLATILLIVSVLTVASFTYLQRLVRRIYG